MLKIELEDSYVVPYLNRLSDLMWIIARTQEKIALTAREKKRNRMPIEAKLSAKNQQEQTFLHTSLVKKNLIDHHPEFEANCLESHDSK